MLRTSIRAVLPQRALAQTKKKAKTKKTTTTTSTQAPLVPYIPPELTKETVGFFNNQPRAKALLELVFSPLDPSETESDRKDYEEARAEYDTLEERSRRLYEAHERRAHERVWKAVQQLPEDLYEEAVQSNSPVPPSLLFHARHREGIFSGLDAKERRYLQCFHNLMYVRYPHSDEKKKHPERFLVPETQVISRQKEAAMAIKKVKKR